MLVSFVSQSGETFLINTDHITRVEYSHSVLKKSKKSRTNPDHTYNQFFSTVYLDSNDNDGCERYVTVRGTPGDILEECRPSKPIMDLFYDFSDIDGVKWDVNAKTISSICKRLDLTDDPVYEITLITRTIIRVTKEVYEELDCWLRGVE